MRCLERATARRVPFPVFAARQGRPDLEGSLQGVRLAGSALAMRCCVRPFDAARHATFLVLCGRPRRGLRLGLLLLAS